MQTSGLFLHAKCGVCDYSLTPTQTECDLSKLQCVIGTGQDNMLFLGEVKAIMACAD